MQTVPTKPNPAALNKDRKIRNRETSKRKGRKSYHVVEAVVDVQVALPAAQAEQLVAPRGLKDPEGHALQSVAWGTS